MRGVGSVQRFCDLGGIVDHPGFNEPFGHVRPRSDGKHPSRFEEFKT